ncbi:pollen-specific protein C13-like [Magnolia sinica]|uniref:pollen-specific protein C13-like n=1 Tax=Magnolia sinica TaxID=86752 RepID=UPI00265A03CB|nr:pollen-specific protein C13-like [Magnolia sinica]
MARLLILIALCVLPALVSARPARSSYLTVKGRVYCDTCLAGFETSATTYIAGAQVRVQCRERESGRMTYSTDGVTDQSGTYLIPASDNHDNEICETVLVSSPQKDCATVMPDRERARVFLSRNNGIVSDFRYANNLGFQKNTPLAGCTQVLQQYHEFDN